MSVLDEYHYEVSSFVFSEGEPTHPPGLTLHEGSVYENSVHDLNGKARVPVSFSADDLNRKDCSNRGSDTTSV